MTRTIQINSATPAAVVARAPEKSPQHARAHRRGAFIKWLRKAHGWLGLWGAAMGLMFGISGFFQNHRAVMKIDTPAPVVTRIRMQVPETVPQEPADVAAWLQREWNLVKPVERVARSAGQTVSWNGQTVQLPEHWQIRFRTPHYLIQADYTPATRQVSARQVMPGWLGVIENLHRANGVGMAWVLLSDTIAGSLVLLSLTGLLLWTELERRKLVGATVFAASVAAVLAATAVTL
ncbi:PepSY-associated TM helix domain-containing protein [Bordetella sp. FB-8]|uniref:PepSY-associated TM helix domain-containing protein n=1 Tax=Bordetella sp. FB-8 TaxID=1159870 RepID=UPI000362E1E2|nr:PepSY-associated TM helix domain-containing protein [Bordetella sp. FB-8]